MAKSVLLLSDSHGYLDERILAHAGTVDEVWHAGDWGDETLSDALQPICVVRGVFGNIDGQIIRNIYPKELYFSCENLKVFMTHIGGYPGRYAKGVKETIERLKPDLFISGHSHICKIVRDKRLNLIHFNPGAIGIKGFHKKRTMIKFVVKGDKIEQVKVLEYEKFSKE